MRYVVLTVALLMAGCNRLPRELRSEIDTENDRLQEAHRLVERAKDAVRVITPARDAWRERMRASETKLAAADQIRDDLKRESSEQRATQMVAEGRRLRLAVVDDARAVEQEALHWIDVQRNLSRYTEKVKQGGDFTAASAAVEKAGQDWPAKKSDLESRLASMKQRREAAQTRLQSNPNDVAAVIEMEQADPAALQSLTGQLYDSWDKVLEDLDENHGTYREKLKIFRTHYTDVPAKKTEVKTDEQWVDVPESSYRAVEKDLGMSIAHKDAGLYDSEAKNLAQPPGYAYIAPPSVGSNQYGYWTHNSSGSFWTFLPQYLILRELLGGRNYQPIVIDEYNRYSAAQRAGRTYYGIERPGSSTPKFGTRGTFTQQRYSGSRYVQSGGFRGSGYTSGRDTIAPERKSFGFPRSSPGSSDPTVGKRFGSGSRSSGQGFGFGSSSGKRFGSPSGGRRFGGGSRRR